MITSTLRNLLYPLKLFISILMILMAANAYDASIESNDSDSDDIEINPFRQLPPRPTVDIEMESVTNYLNGMALEERDSSQYTKDLNAHIHKCQELHAVLCEMLKITTVACMYPYR